MTLMSLTQKSKNINSYDKGNPKGLSFLICFFKGNFSKSIDKVEIESYNVNNI